MGTIYKIFTSPLYLYILIRALTLLLPGGISFMIAYIIKNKTKME